MGDQYPYHGNYKRKPMDAFLQGFLESLSKVTMYKMQKDMEEDSATKRQKMERDWYAEKERLKAEAEAADPDKALDRRYKSLQIDKMEKELNAPEKKSILEQYFGSLGLGGGAMPPAAGGAAPSGMFGDLAATIGKEPGQGGLEVGQARAMRELFGAEKGVGPALAAEMVPTQESEAEAVAAEDQVKMDADADAEKDTWSTLIKAGRAGNNEEADALLTQKKADTILGSKPAKPEQKYRNQFDVELAAAQGDPEATDVLSKLDKRESDKADASTLKLTPRAKKIIAVASARGIKPPELPAVGMGKAGTELRGQLIEAWAEEVENLPGGIDEYSENRVMQKAIGAASQKQEMNLSFTSSYVANLGKQVKRVTKEYLPALKRVDAAILNKPISWWETHVPGSADEAIVSMYVKEISSEIARLSAGSALSIAMIPEGNRAEWERVHDKTLPVKYLDKVLKETHHAGTMRLDSLRTEAKVLRNMVRTNDWDAPHSGDMDIQSSEVERSGSKYDGKKMFGVKGQAAPEPAAQAQQAGPKEGDLFDGVDPTSGKPIKAKFINGKWIRVQ